MIARVTGWFFIETNPIEPVILPNEPHFQTSVWPGQTMLMLNFKCVGASAPKRPTQKALFSETNPIRTVHYRPVDQQSLDCGASMQGAGNFDKNGRTQPSEGN